MNSEELFDFPEPVLKKAQKVKFVLTDVDGVLTKGDINYNKDGEEFKSFNAKDGLGVKLLTKSGFRVGVITGRNSRITDRRCEELGMTECFQGIKDKTLVFEKILLKYELKNEEVAYIGDDWNDLSVLERVGLSVSPADAHPAVRKLTHYTTKAHGGMGAFRELTDLLLIASGQWLTRLNEFRKC